MSKLETARDILYSLPARLKKEKAEGLESIFHFTLEGENGGDFTVALKDGVCTVEEGHNGDAACVVKSKASTYADVELGKTNANMAVMMGKIKISNLGEMMKFISLFKSAKDFE
jgi:putative sterol carrier protein